jgi:hypothetical protein
MGCQHFAGLGERCQIFNFALAHELEKAADGKLCKVGGGSVELARCPIPVLFVDHDRGGVILEGVRDVANAAWLLARSDGELAQNIAYLFPIFSGESHANDKADHGAS